MVVELIGSARVRQRACTIVNATPIFGAHAWVMRNRIQDKWLPGLATFDGNPVVSLTQ